VDKLRKCSGDLTVKRGNLLLPESNSDAKYFIGMFNPRIFEDVEMTIFTILPV